MARERLLIPRSRGLACNHPLQVISINRRHQCAWQFLWAILLAPVAASAGPQCVLPTEPASAALPREAGVASVAVPKQTGLHLISPDQIERSAALRRITAQGAEAFDIGTSHGLRGVFARKGDTFQVFYITPENQAVIVA